MTDPDGDGTDANLDVVTTVTTKQQGAGLKVGVGCLLNMVAQILEKVQMRTHTIMRRKFITTKSWYHLPAPH